MLLFLFLFSLFQRLWCAPLNTRVFDIDVNESEQFLRASDELAHTFGRRGVSQIVISCLATIFACTWTAIHPGIPPQGQSRFGFLYRRLNITGYALLAPELILFWALQERVAAKSNTDQFNSMFTREGTESPPLDTTHTLKHPYRTRNDEPPLTPHKPLASVLAVPKMLVGLGNTIGEYPSRTFIVFRKWLLEPILPPPPKEGDVIPWTTTHDFFLQMGGFVLCKDTQPARTLSGKDFMDLIEARTIDIPAITEDDIRDRCKGDYLTKGATVIQTTWFVFQCASRWSAGLPVTELEVTTLGFAMLNTITYILWWNKPQNIRIPIYLNAKRGSEIVMTQNAPGNDVSSTARTELDSVAESVSPNTPTGSVGTADDEEDTALGLFSHFFPPQSAARAFFMQHHWRQHNNPLLMFLHLHYNLIRSVLIHDSILIRKHPIRFFFGASVGVLFGLVHLLPSLFLGLTLRTHFMWLWRACSIVMTAIPLVYLILTRIFDPVVFTSGNETSVTKHQRRAMQILAMVTIVCVYSKLAVRPIIAFLALTSLRHLPPAALQTISWVILIPHI